MPRLVPKGPQITDQRAWLKDRNKYVSGFCSEINKPGQHEGTKPRDHRGVAMKTCPFWMDCPCQCHWDVDQLFIATGMERLPVPNPEYQLPESEFVMPYVPETMATEVALTPLGATTPPDREGTPTDPPAPAVTPLASRRTDTGRAARGGLEAQVWEALQTVTEQPLTPKVIAAWIADKYTIPTPSSGAIQACWIRWEKLEFAEWAKKPVRFVKFTNTGTWEELQRLKQSAKNAKKSAASAARRGFR